MSVSRIESAQLAAATRAAEELRAAAALSVQLDQETLAKPSVLPAWSVGDVLRHMGEGAFFLTECLQAFGESDPAPTPMDCELQDLLAMSATGLLAAAHQVRGIHPQERANIYEQQAGMPMSMLADILDFEFATHIRDVSWSLGSRTPLRSEAVESVLRLFGAELHRIGASGTAPKAPISFSLQSTDGKFDTSVSYVDGQWSKTRQPGEVHIAGPSDALAMLILGRIDALDPWLTTTGEPLTALEFNRYFPGPS